MTSPPAVTVAIICDYASGEEDSTTDIRAALCAIAEQDFDEPFEVFLVESEHLTSFVPSDAQSILPRLQIVTAPEDGSYELKNAAARCGSADLIALLDADCVPAPNWLRLLVAAARTNRDAVAVSGKTEYPGRTLSERCFSVLSRAFVDPGGRGETRFISNNNALFRRSDLLRHPLPTGLGPFACRLQCEQFRREGRPMLFEPDTRVVHGFDGWSTERDLRSNFGYGCVLLRQVDPQMPHAWIAYLGVAAIPATVFLRTLDSWWNCLRVGSSYGVRWFELPYALALAVVSHTLEIPGMLAAYRGEGRPPSRFR